MATCNTTVGIHIMMFMFVHVQTFFHNILTTERPHKLRTIQAIIKQIKGEQYFAALKKNENALGERERECDYDT